MNRLPIKERLYFYEDNEIEKYFRENLKINLCDIFSTPLAFKNCNKPKLTIKDCFEWTLDDILDGKYDELNTPTVSFWENVIFEENWFNGCYSPLDLKEISNNPFHPRFIRDIVELMMNTLNEIGIIVHIWW